MRILLILFIFTSFLGCLPEQAPVTVQEVSNLSDSSEDSSTPSTSDDVADSDADTVFTTKTHWLNSGLSSEIITLDANNAKSVYLVGDQIHNYLTLDSDNDGKKDNYNDIYCVELRFNSDSSNTPNRLRVKAVAGYSNSYVQGQTTRFLRVNLSTSDGNDYCADADRETIEIVNGVETEIEFGDSDYDGDTDSADTSIVYSVADVCPSCSNIIATSSVVLYQENSDGNLARVDTDDISYEDLTLRININSDTTTETGSCSDTECSALGFDCCVDGQCVNEKTVRTSGVQADPTGFAIAEQEKYSNISWYKKYPQFYYICLEQQPVDTDDDDSSEPEDPVADADARLTELKSDYECISELSEKSETDPFHTNPVNSSESYTKCETSDTTADNYYETVMKRMYVNCGCVEKDDLSTMITSCPKYTYSATYQVNSDGTTSENIISVSCVVPEVEQTPLPFQDLELAISSKSAPHRFFDSTGVELYADVALPDGATGEQEGTEFKYLDDYMLFPNNDQFNMNSIIGQMTTSLDKARPAVKVDLEFDKQYIISTRSGFATFCPTCGKDSWFANFSAAPTVSQGTGLQPVRFTTTRDTYGSNTTLGNYEDTVFGRACWLPPTMIPFSHSSNADTQTQRLNRLQTQAALYINGYQRDWHGFNKGAVIGSFDGVTWFAIGKGRIVTSTSDRLYIAINAPFADLTSPNEHIISVQEYDFSASAPQYDYMPDLEINDAFQNEAATCQEYHECEVDSHCITKLGWEYVCGEVSVTQTRWPSFEPEGANEISNTSLTGAFYDFLQQKRMPPGGTTKRCIYRGAGSPCRKDYNNISDEEVRKALACAPNFYCADLNDATAFNVEVARFARPLDELIVSKNHFYGQDADVLGRPKNYINNSSLSTLPSEVQTTIEENVLLTDSTALGNVGVCRPGKSLPEYDPNDSTVTTNTDPVDQHQAKDSLGRTDFINQISGCNAALYTDKRYSSCPILDEDGNYVHLQDGFVLNNSFYIETLETSGDKDFTTEFYSFSQNSCGLESLDSSTLIGSGIDASDLEDFSAFKTIEADTLISSDVQIEPTLVRDACFRKAGAVCHTDLDCSPNKMFADVIDLVNPSFFGNDAEKSYYEEYLVCGQALSEPNVTDDHFNTYTMHNNRCCRPVGQDISMYTEDSPNAEESSGLQSHLFGGVNPNNDSRYSRYSVVGTQINSSTLEASIVRPSADTTDSNNDKALDNSINITNLLQWTTIHEAASKTCCGGSWVRKFEDGTNNWSLKRLKLDPADFSCLNYNSQLVLAEEADEYGLTTSQLNSLKNLLCQDPTRSLSGCIQEAHLPFSDLSTIIKPQVNGFEDIIEIYSNNELMNDDELWKATPWAYHQFQILDGIDTDGAFILDWDKEKNSDEDIDDPLRENFITELPAYIPVSTTNASPFDVNGDAIDDIQILLQDPQQVAGYRQCGRVVPTSSDYTCPNGRSGICTAKADWSEGACAVATGSCYDDGGNPIPAFDDNYAGCMGNNLSNTFDFIGRCSDPTYDGDQTNCLASGETYTDSQFCCYMYDETNRSLTIAHNEEIKDLEDNFNKKTLGFKVTYTAPGTLAWSRLMDGISTSELHNRSSTPGNALYYLKKLGKLEYLGIPQMTYEPVYCNDNYANLVPGIFKEEVDGLALKTVSDFINHPRTFQDSNADTPWQTDPATAGTDTNINMDGLNQNLVGTQELIEHDQIFSDNQFKCCIELMGATTDQNMCCSGFAVDSEGNSAASSDESTFTCKLPSGVNLNVYFNKFVSGEGLSSTLGVTPLDLSNDFDSSTGEPKISTAVATKLRAIGEAVCGSGSVRRGGVYGDFQGEPVGPLQYQDGNEVGEIFSIVDSVYDAGVNNDTVVGREAYNNGYVWNHHFYCE